MKVVFEEGRVPLSDNRPARDPGVVSVGIQCRKNRCNFFCWINGEVTGLELSRAAIAAIREKWRSVYVRTKTANPRSRWKCVAAPTTLVLDIPRDEVEAWKAFLRDLLGRPESWQAYHPIVVTVEVMRHGESEPEG